MRSPVTGFSMVSPARIMLFSFRRGPPVRRPSARASETALKIRLAFAQRGRGIDHGIPDARAGRGASRTASPLALGAPKQRAVLAALLLRAQRGRSRATRLVDARLGRAAARLGRAVAPGVRPRAAARARRRPDRDARQRLPAARRAGRARPRPLRASWSSARAQVTRRPGRGRRRRDACRAALALWRGPPLADLAGEPVADARRPAGSTSCALARARAARRRRAGARPARGARPPSSRRSSPSTRTASGCREQLVLALYRCGRQKEALEAYRAARRTLVEELGDRARPGAARARARRSCATTPSSPRPRRPSASQSRCRRRRRRSSAGGSRSRRSPRSSRDGARLVTLTGPGGTGKTRLALAVAEELARGAGDGAVFVDLSPLARPGAARPDDRGRRSASARASLREPSPSGCGPQRMLLVLDNLEQLLAGGAARRGAARARARLRRPGDEPGAAAPVGRARVPGPAAAAPGRECGFEQLAANDAVRLFAQRARAVDPAFQLTDANAPSVAAICARLDGLPLAIELAAARTQLLPPEAMAAAARPVARPARPAARATSRRGSGRSRATLDWSHDALEPAEQALFAQLAVFAGGFALDAAEAVSRTACARRSSRRSSSSSLVRRPIRPSRGSRMLETIREYAASCSRRPASGGRARVGHGEHFLAVAEAARAKIARSGRRRAASTGSTASTTTCARRSPGRPRPASAEPRCACASRDELVLGVRGHLREGRRAFEHAVARHRGRRRAPLRARARPRAPSSRIRQGDLDDGAAPGGRRR